MSEPLTKGALWLLLDTCGEQAWLALARDGRVIAERTLAERTASGTLLSVVREVLVGEGGVDALQAVGVVHGPGSFTGLRVGLAMAKGLCEGTGASLAAVSRLAVLAESAGLRDGLAVLWAGREQVYVREVRGGGEATERMMAVSDLVPSAAGRDVVVMEERLWEVLRPMLPQLRRAEREPSSVLILVQRCLAAGGTDVAAVDANYVRQEETIYKVKAQAAMDGSPA